MNERRQGILTDTGKARRWNDKLTGFILGVLLVFLLNWCLGCQGAQVNGRDRSAVDCSEPYFLDDFRCQVYLPEPEIEYDDTETEASLETEF